MSFLHKHLTPTVRAWLYGIGLAVCALLVAYGVLTEENVTLWNALIGAVLGVAIVNTPMKGGARDEN